MDSTNGIDTNGTQTFQPETPSPQNPEAYPNLTDSERKKARMLQHARIATTLLRTTLNGLIKILTDVRVAVLKR